MNFNDQQPTHPINPKPLAATLSELKPEQDSGLKEPPADNAQAVLQKKLLQLVRDCFDEDGMIALPDPIRMARGEEKFAPCGCPLSDNFGGTTTHAISTPATRKLREFIVAPSVVEGVEEKQDFGLPGGELAAAKDGWINCATQPPTAIDVTDAESRFGNPEYNRMVIFCFVSLGGYIVHLNYWFTKWTWPDKVWWKPFDAPSVGQVNAALPPPVSKTPVPSSLSELKELEEEKKHE